MQFIEKIRSLIHGYSTLRSIICDSRTHKLPYIQTIKVIYYPVVSSSGVYDIRIAEILHDWKKKTLIQDYNISENHIQIVEAHT